MMKLLIDVPDFRLPRYSEVQDQITTVFGIYPPVKTLFFGLGYTVEQDNSGTPWLLTERAEFEILEAFKDGDKVGVMS